MTHLRFYIYYTLLHLTLAGSSLVQIGDAISVNLDSKASYKHSSNVLKSEGNIRTDDIYTFTPGAIVNFGKSGTKIDLKLRAYYDILDYQYFSDLNTNLSKVYMNGYFNSSELTSGSFSYSSVEGQTAMSETNTDAAPALLETLRETATFSLSYSYSPKFSFSLGFNQSELTYDSFYASTLSSKKSTTVPLSLIYKYSDKLNVVYGISFTDRDIGEREVTIQGFNNNQPFTLNAYETNSKYYNLGLSGVILPKLTGHFDIGYNTLSFSTNTKDFNSLGANSALTWSLSPKLRTTLTLSRDFDSAGSGRTYRSTSGNLSTVYSINTEYQLSVVAGRTDKYYNSNLARPGEATTNEESLTNYSLKLHYFPSKNYSFNVGYYSAKSVSLSDYKLREFSLTATLKY